MDALDSAPGVPGRRTANEVHAAAARGTATPSAALPHADLIQRAFGRHDISRIRAHTGSEATAATRAMGAQAYATGDHVVLGAGVDLHTVAHEAAHVVQQRAGVHLAGGVGAQSDVYERHADAVADAVVAGRSAEQLLDHGPAGAGSGGGGGAVQRKEVPVWGGVFQDHLYNADDGPDSKGATMLLEFRPRSDLGDVNDAVSLVQTVRDTTKLVAEGDDHTPLATTSLVHERKLTEGGPEELGTAIDQEVLSPLETDQSQRVVNVDPRYSERRMRADQPLKLQPDSSTMGPRSTVKDGSGWRGAWLSDQPSVSVGVQSRQSHGKVRGRLTGDMRFEVAALHNDREFIGSVRWGWKMDGDHPVLDPATLTLGDPGNASPTLLKAAAKWNTTELVDPTSGDRHKTMPLPTASVGREVVNKQKSTTGPRWVLAQESGGYVVVKLKPELELGEGDITSQEHALQMTFDDESDGKDGGLNGPYVSMDFDEAHAHKGRELLKLLNELS
jgi:hypothetical protein